MAKKQAHGRHLTHAEAVRYGRLGGNKLLIWQKRHPEAAKKLEATVRR